jgi:uncharacterized protein involved in outer membrane biogenesis
MVLARNKAVRYAVIALGLAAILVAILSFFPWNALRGPLASYASERLHRPVTIGRLDVSPGWTTRVTLEGLTIGNAAWSQTQPMATFPQMIFTFRLPSLLRLSPTTTRLIEPDVLLERNAEGESNWDLEGASGGAAATIGSIDVERGRVRYVDPTLRARIGGLLQTVPARGDTPQMLEFSGKGTLRGEPFEIEGRSQGIAKLRDIDQPYGLALKARAGKTTIAFNGTVVPAEIQSIKGALHIEGPDLSRLYPIVPSPLPWTPPYDLRGDLSHVGERWIFSGIEGTVGDSDLAGDFTLDLSARRAATIADLRSRRFDYKDLGGFVGLPPGEPAKKAQTAEQKREVQERSATYRVLPRKPFDLGKLREHDVDLKFSGKSVKWQRFPIDNLSTHMVLKGGVMRFEPLDFGIGGGRVVSNITLDVSERVPSARAKIDVRNVELKRIFPQLASPKGSAGRFGARGEFRTRGSSIADMLAAADGEAAVAMRGGEASTLALALTNIDLARAAELLIGGDETAVIHCGVAALHARDGVMTPDVLVVDTSVALIAGSGSVDFRNEKYDLHLEADSKNPSLLALKGPIVIGGTFGTPSIHPAPAPLAARIGAAVGLGAIALPLALLPLIDLGDAPDADCRALYQDARVQTGTNDSKGRSGKDDGNHRKGQGAGKTAAKEAPDKAEAKAPAEKTAITGSPKGRAN